SFSRDWSSDVCSSDLTPFWLSCNESNRMLIEADAGVLQNQTRSLQPGDDAGFKDTINYSVYALNYLNGNTSSPAFSSTAGSTGRSEARRVGKEWRRGC